jgi:phospholipase/carboxylesterase
MTKLTPISRRAFVRGSIGALAASGMAACFKDLTAYENGPRLTARPGDPTKAPMKGSVQDLGLGGGRDGYLYVPESYVADQPIPLFVAMHGAGGKGRDWQSYPARADAHGFAILAPDSRSRTWDIVTGPFGPDVRFLDDALALTFDRVRVDPAHIVLGGFSDGASYALSLGVANGDLFTHLVAYSPGFISPGQPITGMPPIFISHGRQDPILPFLYTQQELVPSLEDAGYDVTFHPFDGDHSVPAEVSEAALAWFLGEPAPGA